MDRGEGEVRVVHHVVHVGAEFLAVEDGRPDAVAPGDDRSVEVDLVEGLAAERVRVQMRVRVHMDRTLHRGIARSLARDAHGLLWVEDRLGRVGVVPHPLRAEPHALDAVVDDFVHVALQGTGEAECLPGCRAVGGGQGGEGRGGEGRGGARQGRPVSVERGDLLRISRKGGILKGILVKIQVMYRKVLLVDPTETHGCCRVVTECSVAQVGSR